jgi:rhomboid protease GluP
VPPQGPPPAQVSVADLLLQLTPRAWVTPTITAVLVLCFVACLAVGMSPLSPSAQDLLRVGGSWGPAVAGGQPWRLFTATLLHAGVLHLGFNLYAFYSAGVFAERLFGNLALLFIYWMSGLGASLLSVVIHPQSISVGASGAIFGVYGALLAFMLLHRGVIPRELLIRQRNSLLSFVVMNVFVGLSVPNVDLAGHAGGLLTGLLVGAGMTRDLLDPSKSRTRRVIATLVAAVLMTGVTVLVLTNLQTVRD